MNEYIIKYNIKMNLQKLRLMNGLRQEDIAEALNVDRTTYTSWELGRSVPKPTQLAELATIFGCSVDFIISEDKVDTKLMAPRPRYMTPLDSEGEKYFSEISQEERAMLIKYRLLNEEGKKQVDEILNSPRE